MPQNKCHKNNKSNPNFKDALNRKCANQKIIFLGHISCDTYNGQRDRSLWQIYDGCTKIFKDGPPATKFKIPVSGSFSRRTDCLIHRRCLRIAKIGGRYWSLYLIIDQNVSRYTKYLFYFCLSHTPQIVEHSSLLYAFEPITILLNGGYLDFLKCHL